MKPVAARGPSFDRPGPAGHAALRVASILALLVLPLLYRDGMREAAFQNGDEAIYAQMASEMLASGRYAELSFDNVLLFPRPPGAVWFIVAAYRLFGDTPPETPLWTMLALVCALDVVLTMVLGARLFGVGIGILGGVLLGFSDLLAGYGRSFESEPILILFVLGAFVAWCSPRRWTSRWWQPWILFGLCLGGALLVKQLVGFLPLAAPLSEWLARRFGLPLGLRSDVSTSEQAGRDRRGLALGLGIALAVALPWHVLMIARHGHAFVDTYFVQSLVGRASTGLMRRTAPTFYLEGIWRSEGWLFAPAWLGSALLLTWVGLRRRRLPELFVAGWGLGVLAIYSMARSRYDYYILLAYPAFALGCAWLLTHLPLRPRLRSAVIGTVVVTAAVVHLPRNLGVRYGDDQTRELLGKARDVAPGAPVYTFNRYPYTARLYSGRPVSVFVDNPRDIPSAAALRATGMPAPAELVSPPQAALRIARRPSLLLLPWERVDVLKDAAKESYQVIGRSPKFQLLLLP